MKKLLILTIAIINLNALDSFRQPNILGKWQITTENNNKILLMGKMRNDFIVDFKFDGSLYIENENFSSYLWESGLNNTIITYSRSDKFKNQKFSEKRFKIIDQINNNCYLAKMYQTNDNIVLCRYFEKPKEQPIKQKKKIEIIMK
ncbi:hypothetical protein [Campylobacter concisus]|jgi:hypothetical protein|uniref:hypothetical protein n=1 Tax=Campylobacter concisus TaxID=199 RepID=UPI000CD9DAE3|nr:hypothetical protein [Campylobacter concisus]